MEQAVTIDDDLRQQIAVATDLDDEIQVRVGAGDAIRRTGNRMIKRRRIAVASAAVAVVGIATGTAGLFAGHHDRSGPPPAVRPPAPAATTVTHFVRPLRVDAIVSEHAGACQPGELPAVDGTACYRLAASGGFAFIKVANATLYPPFTPAGTVPGTPPEQQIAIELAPQEKAAWSALTARTLGRQVAFSLDGLVVEAPHIQDRIVGGELSLSAKPGFAAWLWRDLTGHLPSGATPVLPPATASPEAVVRAYVAAINRHDLATVLALQTAQHAVDFNQDDGFSNIISISKLTISPARDESSSYAAAREYRQVVQVPVEFDLRQHRVESRPNGRIPWGYLLARNSDSQPWRILDEGVA